MKQLKKTILTLVALLALTTGAWADETLLTTITPTGDGTYSETTAGAVTVTPAGSCFYSGSSYGWVWDDYGSLTVTANEGYTITKCVFRQAEKSPVTISEAPFALNFESFLCLENYDMDGVSSIEVYGAAPASSGPKVAWTAATKTGTFDMPGGNVELEPEYYPQAALTAAPTAINDVPATTDGAIVNAGTVANIDGTTTAQGTVMYYVSQTALDDAALLALAADAWTADVPTAQSFTAAGQAYVYYYVRGNDGDTDETTFSDGDILSANALTVTIAAAPTYAVTFAEGVNPEPPAEPEWTASPNTDVKKGETVTVTYTGSKKVLGVKAEKKAAAELPKYADVVTICEKNGDNKYLVSSFFDGTNANITTITKEEAIALAEYLGGGDIRVVYEEYEFSGTRYVRTTKAAGNTSGILLSTTNTCNVPLYYVPAGN